MTVLPGRMSVLASTALKKRLCIVRHGQAMHNPRAEVAKANGCSMEEFVSIMREDDALDAELTPLGREQARSVKLPNVDNKLDLVVSSPLSRALETADLIHPPTPAAAQRRVAFEAFREVNGDLLCAKRMTKTELQGKFPTWDFNDLQSDHDNLWTPQIERFEDAAERGYQGLCRLMEREEDSILLVGHGGTLRYMMTIHPLISLRDERKKDTASNNNNKAVEARFDNCEVRQYLLSWDEQEGDDNEDNGNLRRPIILTQLDH